MDHSGGALKKALMLQWGDWPALLLNLLKTLDLATPAGFEPATNSLEGYCSVQLSYGAVAPI